MTRTVEQWAYGATLDFYEHWLGARRRAYANRPRRRVILSPLVAAMVAGNLTRHY